MNPCVFSALFLSLYVSSGYAVPAFEAEGQSVWYLLQYGNDTMGCGTTAITACRTIAYLLQSFNHSGQHNNLQILTDTSFVIDNVEQETYPMLGNLNVSISAYNHSLTGQVDLVRLHLFHSNWHFIGIKFTITSCNISTSYFSVRSHKNHPVDAYVNSTYLGFLSFKDIKEVVIENSIAEGNQRSNSTALAFFATPARITSCLFNEIKLENSVIIINDNSKVIIEKSNFIQNSIPNGTIYVDNESQLTLRKCEFFHNQASDSGGCVFLKRRSILKVDNCTFFNNTAQNYGGAVMSQYNTLIEIGNGTVFDRNIVLGRRSYGGAIANFHNVKLIAKDTVFQNHFTPFQGGALSAMSNSSIYLDSTGFHKNTAIGSSGAIQCYFDCVMKVKNTTFRNNVANDGGGIETVNATVELNNCTFENNTSLVTDTGAFTAVENSSVRITNCLFHKNTAGRFGPAMQFFANVDVEIDHCNFTDNVAQYGAGAIYAENFVKLRIIGSRFINNTANRGGGVLIGGITAYLNITDSYFINNTCMTGAGGVIDYFRDIYVDNSIFVNNRAGNKGGAIGKTVTAAKTKIMVKDCVFLNNSAQLDGGAIFCEKCHVISIRSNYTGNIAQSSGGGVVVTTQSHLFITNGTFKGNYARYSNGGALLIGGSSSLQIDSGRFIKNSGVYGGGAVYMYATEKSGFNQINNTIFEDNYVHFMGAALYVGPGAKIVSTNCTFVNNAAKTYGGAVKVDESAETCFEGCSFINNSAQIHGGAFYVKQQQGDNPTTRLKLSICSFIDNQSRDGTGIYIFSNKNNPPELKTLRTIFSCGGISNLSTADANFTLKAKESNLIILSEPDQKLNLIETPYASVIPEVCLGGCKCRYDLLRMANIYDCSSKGLSELPPSVEKGTNWMIMSHTNIGLLSGNISYFKDIVGLDFSFSNLKHICPSFLRNLFAHKTLKTFNIQSSKITHLPEVIKKYQFENLYIGNNPYHCICKMKWMHDWLVGTFTSPNNYIRDFKEATCTSGIKKVRGKPIVLTDGGKMGCDVRWYEIAAPVVAAVFIVIATLSVMKRYIDAIRFQVYLKFDILTGKDDDQERLDEFDFDLFVSHSHLDNHWFINNILPHLEDKHHFDICVPERDWDPSSTIADCITTAIDSSRRMIIVLSKNYIQSRWCMEEFIMAHTRLKEGRTKLLIPIMLEDITHEQLDPTLDLYIKAHHYIKVANNLDYLQKKLVYALPRKPLRELLVAEAVREVQIHQVQTGAHPVDHNQAGPSGEPRTMIHGLASEKLLGRLTKKGYPGDEMRERMKKNYSNREKNFKLGKAKRDADKKTAREPKENKVKISEHKINIESDPVEVQVSETTPLLLQPENA